jgi:hypothetical protein
MTRIQSFLLAACLSVVSPVTRAEAGWTDYVRVIELIPTTRHYYEIQLAVEDNPSGCREDDWFYLNYDQTGSDKMFDLFVDGLKNSLRLRVYVTGVCNLNGYAEISAVGARAN